LAGVIVLDAGVIIALFTPGDAHHDRAKKLLADDPGPFLMHPLTVAETLVGAARVGREAEMWRALRALRVEAVDMGPDEPALVATLRARHSLKMPDTCVLAAATHLDAPLATFDDRLGAVADQLSLRHHT
jgi:predicted nucleic acid-binding protein